jgi:hypothetical protein
MHLLNVANIYFLFFLQMVINSNVFNGKMLVCYTSLSCRSLVRIWYTPFIRRLQSDCASCYQDEGGVARGGMLGSFLAPRWNCGGSEFRPRLHPPQVSFSGSLNFFPLQRAMLQYTNTSIAVAILCSAFLWFGSYLLNFTRCKFVPVKKWILRYVILHHFKFVGCNGISNIVLVG